jgi:hypothetical protein
VTISLSRRVGRHWHFDRPRRQAILRRGNGQGLRHQLYRVIV